MRIFLISLIGFFATLVFSDSRTASLLGQDGSILFRSQVKPTLSETCFKCHGPDDATREADLRLDTLKMPPAIVVGMLRFLLDMPTKVSCGVASPVTILIWSCRPLTQDWL